MSSTPPKYRSVVRDQLREIRIPTKRSTAPARGVIQYGAGSPLLSVMLADAKELNRKEFSEVYGAESKAVVDSLDNLHALAAAHSGLFDGFCDAIPNPAHVVIFACFRKSLLSLHASHELTLDGLYGLARPHLRQAFESLMIAKFCSTDPDSDIFDKWIDGIDLYLTNGVLKKLSHPNVSEFSDAWGLFSQWTHATVYANQLSLDIETTRKEASLNLAFIGVLIHFAYHLLNTHILTPTIKYYVKRYSRSKVGIQAKENLKLSLKVLRKELGQGSRCLIRDYKATWKLK